jgi:hypothetical protein
MRTEIRAGKLLREMEKNKGRVVNSKVIFGQRSRPVGVTGGEKNKARHAWLAPGPSQGGNRPALS